MLGALVEIYHRDAHLQEQTSGLAGLVLQAHLSLETLGLALSDGNDILVS